MISLLMMPISSPLIAATRSGVVPYASKAFGSAPCASAADVERTFAALAGGSDKAPLLAPSSSARPAPELQLVFLFDKLPTDAVKKVNDAIPKDENGQPKFPENKEVNGYVNQHFITGEAKADNLGVCERLPFVRLAQSACKTNTHHQPEARPTPPPF